MEFLAVMSERSMFQKSDMTCDSRRSITKIYRALGQGIVNEDEVMKTKGLMSLVGEPFCHLAPPPPTLNVHIVQQVMEELQRISKVGSCELSVGWSPFISGGML